MDEFGRLAATELAALDLDAAWWALAGFPAASNEDVEPDEGNDSRDTTGDGRVASTAGVAAYPVRQMMELIENIAAKQTTIANTDWLAWCARLEQTLCLMAESPVLTYFQALGLNPLSPLRVEAFRPSFAETQEQSAEGQMYDSVLDRIEDKWRTGNLSVIGGGRR
ncbi:hypothetical protein [Sphaerotilus hippei]|nr:hypothetical protein [Sphaerotilus hippei]